MLTGLLVFLICARCVQPAAVLTAMESCILRVSVTYFAPGRLVLVSASNKEATPNTTVRGDAVIGALHATTLWPVMAAGARTLHISSSLEQEVAISVVLVLELDHSVSQLDSIVHHFAWSSRAQFLVAISHHSDITSQTETAKNLLSQMWKRKVANVVVLLPTLDIYSWQPYNSSSHCGGDVQNAVWINGCHGDNFLQDTNLYPDKIPVNLHGCLVNVSTFPWYPFIFDTTYLDENNQRVNSSLAVTEHYDKGIEVNLIDAVAEATNFKLRYIKTEKSDWSYLVDNVIQGDAEVVFAAIPPHLDKYPLTDVTVSYMKLPFSWFVPTEKPISRWQSLFRVFTPSFWLVVGFSYVLAAVTQWLLGRQRSSTERSVYRQPVQSFFGALAVMLGVSVIQPRSGIVRAFFFLWVIYSLQVNTAYQSMLMVVLSDPGLEPPITNLEELLESELHIGFTPRIYTVLKDMNEGRYNEVLQRYESCTDYEGCLGKVAYQRDYAFVTVRTYGEFMMDTKYVENGKSLLKPLEEDIFVSDIHMCLKKGSLLLGRFNSVITRILEAGMLVKWWEDLKTTSAADQRKKIREDSHGNNVEDDRVFVLTITHLQSVFDMLVIGLIMATVTFISEIASYRLKERRKNII